ncbi:MAG: glycosyltransferase family 9 protein [Candidatus Promineifilaceae bacterium]|jgi:heptosyltransferase-2
MPRENVLTTAVARLARVPFALSRRDSFHRPHKALILQTCCLSQVMLATPLLAALSETYPEARFDWAVTDWARPAIASNPRVTEIIPIGETDLRKGDWRQIRQLVLRLRSEHYDTIFIPSGTAIKSYIAWQAGIHQRIGLNIEGRGFAHTIPVALLPGIRDRGAQGLLLAEAAGVPKHIISKVNMEYWPAREERASVTQRLIEEVGWLGDVPLVIIHPGGGVNPRRTNLLTRWPEERFVILGNHLKQNHQATIILVGTAEEKSLANDIAGMMAGKVVNYCGKLGFGEVSALCEVADLFVGNDTGTSQIAAASGCRTLVIYGPTNPALSKPYSTRGNVHTLWRDLSGEVGEGPFTWDGGITADEAIAAVDAIIRQPVDSGRTLSILSRKRREKD